MLAEKTDRKTMNFLKKEEIWLTISMSKERTSASEIHFSNFGSDQTFKLKETKTQLSELSLNCSIFLILKSAVNRVR